ncbi:hypothetical protein B5G02_06595 [[Collinsella] massiliensis]|uniref:DUF2326 domain-containing protein n=2 Tax=Coriobacteriaceae TaxID=84107 RepID=A0A1Y3XSE8_9ACTN|nr:hypothetical protein B5G02_06595 [[Collinsella] massiliensis]
MREVSFHKGANFVVDTEDSKRHNKVGKTTFLKLIDVLMGAQNRSHIYTDQETNTEAIELRDTINKKRIAAEMTLSENLDAPYGKTVELKVELFPRGRYFIDGERMSQTNYRSKLNELLFGIANNVPTFRQLINSFVRVSVGGDDNAFLRTLTRASIATYRSVYNFLFDISDPELDSKLSQLNAQLNRTRESLRQYMRVNGVEDVEQQRQILVALEGEYAQAKAQADDIFDADEYKSNRDAIASVRAEYASLVDQLSELDYRIGRNREALNNARAEKQRRADLELSRRFFDEVCTMLPNLNKTFEDMVSFNDKLCDNKISYFEDIERDLLDERTSLENEQKALLASNSQFLSLVAKDRIDEYERLSANLMQLRQDIGRCQETVDTLDRYDHELASIQENIASYSTGGSARKGKGGEYQEMMSSFNGYFTHLAQQINGEKPILVYYPDTDKFPVSITAISGSSTGTRKSLIAAFDLAYQQFAIANRIHTPRFIVHDVVENVEGEDLRTIVNAANGIDAQYIVAVLKEKLDSSNIPEDEQSALQILQLSEDDKLFEGKTVDEAESSDRMIEQLASIP